MRQRGPRSLRRKLQIAAGVLACVIGVPIAILFTIGFIVGVKDSLSVPPGRQMQLVLPLRVDDAGLNRFVEQVSTPGGPQYHHYEPIAWLASHFGAPAPARRKVIAFLDRQGATNVSVDRTGLFVSATLSAAKAERIFGIKLDEHHQAGHAYTAPTGAVTLPAGLRPYVTSVVGLNTRTVELPSFGGIGTTSTGAASTTGGRTTTSSDKGFASGYVRYTGTPRGCPAALSARAAMGFAPNQYLTAYGYAPLQARGLTGGGITVALVEIDGFKRSDIQHFARCFGLRVPPIHAYGVGVGHQLMPGGETTLDLEVLDAAAPGLAAVDVYETHSDVADVLQALAAPLQSARVPQIVSVSLGQCELATVDNAGRAAVQAAESELEEATASGITVLASTGDSGSADCPGRGSSARPASLLAVNYPASSPWVTAVGGTNLRLDGANAITGQTVWNDGSQEPGDAGGGGVSELFSRPTYQDHVVRGAGRALPDVAMLADLAPGYDIYCTAHEDCDGAGWSAFGGTSAATPLLAGGFAMVDQALNQHGLQTLGFVNPLLYQLGESMTERAFVYDDVRTGDNDVGLYTRGHRSLGCCSAAPGFDEASGWGSLDLRNFEADALTSESPLVKVTIDVPLPQNVIRAAAVYADVTCAGPCHTRALVAIQIGNAKPLYVLSRDYTLSAAGTRHVEIPLSPAQLLRIRHATAAGTPTGAGVIAATLDAGGNEERLSKAVPLRIG